jgi:DNA-binding NarL/FixJ family response regulator
MEGNSDQLSDSTPPPELTKREREVLVLLAQGSRNKSIAKTLGISVRTAEVYRAHIMDKLNLHSMSDLMIYAVRNQIVVP